MEIKNHLIIHRYLMRLITIYMIFSISKIFEINLIKIIVSFKINFNENEYEYVNEHTSDINPYFFENIKRKI